MTLSIRPRLRALPARLLRAALLAAAFVAPGQAATLHLGIDPDSLDTKGLTTVLTAQSRLLRPGTVEVTLAFPRGREEDARGESERVKGVASYDLTLRHDAARGLFTFTLEAEADSRRHRDQRDGETTRLRESRFAERLDFNLLQVFAMATTPGTTVAFTDLFFKPGEGLGTEGVLETMGRVEQSGMESYGQWMGTASGTNLARFDWTIGAHVTVAARDGKVDGGAGGGVAFGFAGLRGDVAPPDLTKVPEPAAIAMFGLGLAALGFAQLRRGRNARTQARPAAGRAGASAMD